MLIQVLRMSFPSLAEALAVGLVALLTPATGRPAAEISLAHKRAVLVAVARTQLGDRVQVPHTRPTQVGRLDVIDLAVGGLFAVRMAG